MKRWFGFALVVVFLTFIALLAAMPVQAQEVGLSEVPRVVNQEAAPVTFDLQDLVRLVIGFGSMAGVAALVAIVVDVFKRFGLVRDGEAPRWSAALNLLLLIGLVAARYLAPQYSVEFLDEQAGTVAQLAAVILSFVMQLSLSPQIHDTAVRENLPIAFSHSSV